MLRALIYKYPKLALLRLEEMYLEERKEQTSLM